MSGGGMRWVGGSHMLAQDDKSVVSLGEGAEYVAALRGAQEHGNEEVGSRGYGDDVAGRAGWGVI